MKFHRARPVCRAPNCFSPSVLLYQNFVAPYHAARHQRFSSPAFAPQAAESESPNDSSEVPLPSSATTEVKGKHRSPAQAKIRLLDQRTRTKGKPLTDWKRRSGSEPNISTGNPENRSALAHASETYVARLLLKAKLACDDGEEYHAILVRPYAARVLVPEQKWPWAAKSAQRNLDAMSRLNREINDFYEYAKPTRAETFARKNIVEQVRADVRTRLPNHILEVFGSERTGMALALSDIDLRLVKRDLLDQQASDKPPTPEARRDFLRNLYDLRYKVFDGANNVDAAKYISPTLRHARYPLVSVQDRGSGLDVQVVAANDTAKQREFIQRYMKEYPYLRQTYAVIKTMFDQRGLSDVFRGGFGSYPLFMMIVVSLQNQPNQRRDAAGALINFLYYWAYFKTKEKGVSVAPSKYFDKKENPILTDTTRSKISAGTTKPLPDYLLSLRDPADETNDLGRKATSILHAQATLRYLVADTIENLNANNRPSLLAEIVGEVYARDRVRRDKLADHGLWIQQQVQKSFAAAAEERHDPAPPLQTNSAQPAPKEEEGDIHGFLEADAETTENTGSVAGASQVQATAPAETPDKQQKGVEKMDGRNVRYTVDAQSNFTEIEETSLEESQAQAQAADVDVDVDVDATIAPRVRHMSWSPQSKTAQLRYKALLKSRMQ
ncbi:hypothetical protein P171DRAFT_386352 [Karstenula rhodostoma CBS 690.94]|uniref:Poly(A) RNA polymerase mitochondrial-like central palm domain-containing protein n=1 Tax=Karstenula rhodostoma CBS 690.94 TaxID=1392251 RepID=A0A9P4PM35_9PLEO|nr:hypothetical protein P171DRAFT_386352 [Karstenula rhodostoma CBS 690.94]